MYKALPTITESAEAFSTASELKKTHRSASAYKRSICWPAGKPHLVWQ